MVMSAWSVLSSSNKQSTLDGLSVDVISLVNIVDSICLLLF